MEVVDSITCAYVDQLGRVDRAEIVEEHKCHVECKVALSCLALCRCVHT